MSKNEEDIIFKAIGNGPINVLLTKLGFESENVEILNTELFVVKLSARKADLIIKLDNMYLIIEFQSYYVGPYDDKRFSAYAHMFDLNKNDDLPVYLCVLSTAEGSKTKKYRINHKSVFTFSIVSLKENDENEIINNVNTKIESNQDLSVEELVDFALLPLITKEKNKENIFAIVKNGLFEYDFKDFETKDFIFGIVMLLSNKLLTDGDFKKQLENKLMGQLDCVSRYINEQVSMRVDEELKCIKERTDKVMEQVTRDVTEQVTRDVTERVTRDVTERVTRENSERIAINLLHDGGNVDYVAINTNLPVNRVIELKEKI
ncbi:hypothetical protein [Methanobrevibacter sp.]|uniref:hypothetical protein n=1 Tax=Methanobrevibacter sp. TaxID=66852 RepID=UPI00388F5A88